MRRDRAALLTVLPGIFASVFPFAPVIYGFQRTTPPGENVTLYESPSCAILGIGAYYSYGQSIDSLGQTAGVSSHQWLTQNCNIIP